MPWNSPTKCQSEIGRCLIFLQFVLINICFLPKLENPSRLGEPLQPVGRSDASRKHRNCNRGSGITSRKSSTQRGNINCYSISLSLVSILTLNKKINKEKTESKIGGPFRCYLIGLRICLIVLSNFCFYMYTNWFSCKI